LGARRELALLFKKLATLRTDAPLFEDVESLEWHGPTESFAEFVPHLGDKLMARAKKAAREPRAN
jgi:hypothetical protein